MRVSTESLVKFGISPVIAVSFPLKTLITEDFPELVFPIIAIEISN